MTVQELITELTSIVTTDPKRGELEIFIYITDINELVDFGESPQPIVMIDDSISDRVDINI